MIFIRLVNDVFLFLYIMLFIRVILSWIPNDPFNRFVQFVQYVTEPMLSPFRQLLPPHKIGIDVSPIFAFLALNLAKSGVMWVIKSFLF